MTKAKLHEGGLLSFKTILMSLKSYKPLQSATLLTTWRGLFSIILCNLLSSSLLGQIPSTLDGNPNHWKNVLSNEKKTAFTVDLIDNSQDNIYTQGTSDNLDIPNWSWQTNKSNNKNDIKNSGAYLDKNTQTLYFFGDRQNTNGSSAIAFWFFQDKVGPIIDQNGNKKFSGQHRVGDILVVSSFLSSGGRPTLSIYKWMGIGGGGNATSNGALQTLTGSQNQGAVNTGNVSFSPFTFSAGNFSGTTWSYTSGNTGSAAVGPDVYPPGSFFEGSIYLGDLDVSQCFQSFLVETANSPSLTSSSEDFAAGQFFVAPTPPNPTSPSKCFDGTPLSSVASCGTDNGTLLWYSAATGGTGTTTALSRAAVGSSTAYAACNIDGCESERVPATVTIYETPSAPTAGNASKCYDGSPATASASCSLGTVQWYASANATTPFQVGGTVSRTAVGTSTFWASCKTDNCEGPRTQVTITIYETPSAPTAGNATKCYDGSPATASATCSLGTVQWYASANATTPFQVGGTVTRTAVGTYSFWASCKTDNCEGPRTQVTITIYETPSAPTAGNATKCYDGTPATASASCSLGTVQWYATENATTPFQIGGTVTRTAVGTYSFWASCKTDNCEGPRTQVTIIIYETPSAPTAGNATKCYDGEPAYGSATCSIGTVQWYASANATTPFQVGGTVSRTAVGTSTFYASCKTDNCEGSRTAVTITIYGVPDVTATVNGQATSLASPYPLNGNLANPTANLLATVTNGVTSTFSWTVASGVVGNVATITNLSATNVANPTFSPSSLIGGGYQSGLYAFTVTARNSASSECLDTKTVYIDVSTGAVCPGDISGPANLCMGDGGTYSSTSLGAINFPIAGLTYTWSIVPAGAAQIVGSYVNVPGITVANATGTFTVTLTISFASGAPSLSGTGCQYPVTVAQCVFPHLFPTQTTCCNYVGGNTSSFELTRACITLDSRGNKISNAIPGVFFYYGMFEPTQSGAVTIRLAQSNTENLSPFVLNGNLNTTGGGNANVLVDGCQQISGLTVAAPTNGPNAGNVYFTFNAVSGQRYIILAKYDMKSIVGKNAPAAPAVQTDPWAIYSFRMYAQYGSGAESLVTGSLGELGLYNKVLDGNGNVVACFDNSGKPSGTCPTNTLTRIAPTTEILQTSDLQISAYPNPFNTEVNFRFVSPETGKASLEVFDMVGRKLAIVYEGSVDAGSVRSINYKVPNAHMVPMIYRLTVGDRSVRGTLLPGDREP